MSFSAGDCEPFFTSRELEARICVILARGLSPHSRRGRRDRRNQLFRWEHATPSQGEAKPLVVVCVSGHSGEDRLPASSRKNRYKDVPGPFCGPELCPGTVSGATRHAHTQKSARCVPCAGAAHGDVSDWLHLQLVCCASGTLQRKTLGQGVYPAMASGLTDHVWSFGELLSYKVASAPCVEPKRRRIRPTQAKQQRASLRVRPLLRLRKGVLCSTTV